MAWALDDTRSIYGQIMDRIRQRIVTGQYPPGSRLDSVRDLAQEAGVNPNTMQRALSALEGMGILTSQRTAGRFITEDTALIEKMREDMAAEAAEAFAKAMRELGYGPQEMIEILKRGMEHE